VPPIEVRSELPEWENLVAQVNALYGMIPELAALRLAVSQLDKSWALAARAIDRLEADVKDLRRNVDYLERPPQPQSSPQMLLMLAVFVVVLFSAGLLVYAQSVR